MSYLLCASKRTHVFATLDVTTLLPACNFIHEYMCLVGLYLDLLWSIGKLLIDLVQFELRVCLLRG